ncbi:histone-lysine N-methyltransferase SETMAR isoform X4 [Rhinolophus sinicus]|uniref:histone-lysine N-methyltransferase SETMAR isoform X4 n=1 Tax=Rhinolophus sinicus TaxID=89399 RepID=UPI003D7A1E50
MCNFTGSGVPSSDPQSKALFLLSNGAYVSNWLKGAGTGWICFPLHFSQGNTPARGLSVNNSWGRWGPGLRNRQGARVDPPAPRHLREWVINRYLLRKREPPGNPARSIAAQPPVQGRRKDARLRGLAGFPSHDLPSSACVPSPASRRPAKPGMLASFPADGGGKIGSYPTPLSLPSQPTRLTINVPPQVTLERRDLILENFRKLACAQQLGRGRSGSCQAAQLREGSRRAAVRRLPARARPAATKPKRKVSSAEGAAKEEKPAPAKLETKPKKASGKTMEMMLNKKQIRAIFLFEFKMGRKAAETTRNINNAFGPGTANERTVQWWFKKFCKGDESLEDEEHSGRRSEVDNDQLRAIIEADPLTTTREVAEELNVDHSTVVRHLKQIGKVKKLDKCVPHELTENQKNCRFEVSSSLILRNNNEPFLDRIVTCNEKWILYDNRRRPAQWLDREEAPKHFPKLNLHQIKIMVTVWWSAAGLIHYSFLSPGETITSEKYAQQIDEMHRKLQHLQPALVNRKGPILLHDNARLHITLPTLQKLNELGYEVLPHPPYSPDLSPTDYHFFKHLDNFLEGKRFHNQQDAQNAFQEFVESRSMEFYATGINKLISRWQKCVDCNGSYFD